MSPSINFLVVLGVLQAIMSPVHTQVTPGNNNKNHDGRVLVEHHRERGSSFNKVSPPKKFQCPKSNKQINLKQPAHIFGNHIIIANRSGGSISLVNSRTLKTTVTYELPDQGEPTYFAYHHNKSEIWVGDRANSRLVILRMKGRKIYLDGYLPTPAGLFHIFFTQTETEYPIAYVACDEGKQAVAYDMTTRRFLGTLEPPEESLEQGLAPHDITSNGPYAFVTFANGSNPGLVASYDTTDFSLVSTIQTLSDPHVAVRGNSELVIAATGGEVTFVSVPDLAISKTMTDQPSPHGMFISFDGKFLYVTSILEGGDNAVTVYDMLKRKAIVCPDADTDFPLPHNPASAIDGKKLYITHSGGTSTMNSVFSIRRDGCLIQKGRAKTDFETGSNPFGLYVLPPAVKLLSCSN